MRRTAALALLIGIAGAAATAAAATVFGMTAHQTTQLIAIAGGAALVVGAAGAALLFVVRRRSITVQIAIVALVSVVAAAVGAVVAAQAMFLEHHDVRTLAVVLMASGTVGGVAAVVLGRRVAGGSTALQDVIRSVGTGRNNPEADRLAAGSTTSELAGLAAELERMQERLDDAATRERALEGSRRDLVAWVSHDLRTPLAGIRAITEALEDGVIAEPVEVASSYRTLRQEADRLAVLVDDLFELSVIQAGSLRLHLELASLDDLVSDAVAAASAPARAKGVRLEGRLLGPVPEVELSPPGVTRLLRNLLENAIRHTPSDGSVQVEALVDGRDAVIAVADGCGGIPADQLEHLFDPAFRGEAARTPRDDGGAGLGLAIAKGIAEAHRGAIKVANHGPGCRFEVRLPLQQPEPTR